MNIGFDGINKWTSTLILISSFQWINRLSSVQWKACGLYQWWRAELPWLPPREPPQRPARCTRMCAGYRSGWEHPSEALLKNCQGERLLQRSAEVVLSCTSVTIRGAGVALGNHGYLKGSVSWTSRAAPRIRPSFRACVSAFSSTRPPLDVFTRKAPWRICGKKVNKACNWSMLGSTPVAEAYASCFLPEGSHVIEGWWISEGQVVSEKKKHPQEAQYLRHRFPASQFLLVQTKTLL